jgi:hypothetical protein
MNGGFFSRKAAKEQRRRLVFLCVFAPLREKSSSSPLKLSEKIQREKQSYSECHGPKTPDNQNSASTV